MIFVAAVAIMASAVDRFLHPQPLENVGIGLGISVVASVINGLVAVTLIRAGRTYKSVTLRADGKHLLTDVWTSVGVLVGVLLVRLTGWERLDPIVAFAVGVNIVVAGFRLLAESTAGLMDHTLPDDENARIVDVLRRHTTEYVMFHGLRTRAAGRHGFATFDMLVPGSWTVVEAHDLVEVIEAELRAEVPDVELRIHIEPREDPRSYGDHPVEIPIPGGALDEA